MDDIIIWSNTIEEHECHCHMILKALRKAKLYCNTSFFSWKLTFWVITSLPVASKHSCQRQIKFYNGQHQKTLQMFVDFLVLSYTSPIFSHNSQPILQC